MNFTHDSEHGFYYMGDKPATSHTYQEYLIDRNPQVIGLDVETISLKERIAIGLSIAVEPNKCFYFPLFPVQSNMVPWHLLEDPGIKKVIHNAMFDLACLEEFHIDNSNVADTAVMSRLLCNRFNGLTDLSWVHQMETHEVKEILAEHHAKIILDIPEETSARKCLSYKSKVMLEDGSICCIGKIVNQKLNVSIRCMVGNSIVNRPVIGWYRMENPDKQWVRLYTKYTPSDEGYSYYTPDHEILTLDGYKAISNITYNDRICTTEHVISNTFKQLIIGSCLGDGWLSSKNGVSAGYCSKHTNLEYPLHKQKICGGNIGWSPKTPNSKVLNPQSSWHIESPYLKQIGEIMDTMYQYGEKYVTMKWLEMLEPLGLAFWYMDDGCLFNGETAYLSTEGFSEHEIETIQYYFEVKYGWEWRKQKTKSGYNLRLLKEHADQFFNTIASYVIYELQYKLPKQYQDQYNHTTHKPYIDKLYYVPVDHIEHIELPQSGQAGVSFCIDVEEAHNFVTLPGIIVHNCMQDSGASLRLYQIFYPQMNIPYFETEMETIPIMLRMSERGLLIDHRVRMALEQELEGDVELYLSMCEEAEAFNPASPQQVSYVLAKRGAYEVFSRLPFTRGAYGRPTGNLSSAEEVLEKMDDPLAQLILTFRRKSKLLGTYIKPWAEDARAYTRYHLDAITGRPSSTDRNMQNIPGVKARGGVNARAMFLPDTGMWTDMDFSQLELRILAYMSNDKEMLNIYETEGDIHQITADFLGIPRSVAKNVGFCMIYGGTVQTIMETARIKSMSRAKQLREMWFQLFPGASDLIQTVQHDCHYTGKGTTIFRRNMRLPTEEEESRDGIERKAVNYPIQGSAADILKRALIHCGKMDLALQVHDELLLDGMYLPDRFAGLENIAPFRTPIEIRYLERWE